MFFMSISVRCDVLCIWTVLRVVCWIYRSIRRLHSFHYPFASYLFGVFAVYRARVLESSELLWGS